MAIPLLVAGAALSVYSQYQANQSQAKAEIENANFFELQAQFARETMSREAQLARRKYAATIGAQKGAYAKGGVDVNSGSSLGVIASTLASQMEELAAIRKKGELEATLAEGRAKQARGVAGTLRDPLYNITQGAGTVLTAFALGKG